MDSQRLELDLHRLELRFAGSRLVEPRAVARIAHSIERCGQIVPCVVVAAPGGSGAGGERLVLIDGYRRVAALRRLGRDIASVERWACDVTDALLGPLAWCRNVANQKPRRALGMSPEAAYVIEKPHLKPLPDALPPVYELLERIVDLHGYVSVDTNRYSVPERFVGQSVAVYKLPAEIHVCRKDSTIAVHQRLIGQRDAKSILPEHHSIPVRENRGTAREETLLSGHHPSLDRYAAALKQRGNGWGRRALRRLIGLKRTYPSGPFIAAIEQALQYGMFDLGRLEALILKHVAGDVFALDAGEDGDA